jgi:hypothetical protein
MADVAGRPLDHTGLQAERTQLAWIRTALATGALAALATRLGGGPSTVLAIALGLIVALPGAAASLVRIRELQREPVPRAAPPSTVGLLATSVVLAGLVALVLPAT